MNKCPVCDHVSKTLQCSVCGFDASRNPEKYPTLAPTMSVAARRRAWQERQNLQQQEQQWRKERDQTYADLSTALLRQNQLEQDKRDLQTQLKNAEDRAKSAAENRALKAEYEEKLRQAHNARSDAEYRAKNAIDRANAAEMKIHSAVLAAEQRAAEQVRMARSEEQRARDALTAQQNKTPHKLFKDFLRSFWHRYFREDRNDSIGAFLRNALCTTALVVLLGYLLADQAHWIFLHTSLAFDGAPCAQRPICQIFPCDVYDLHEWQDQNCLMPRTCSVCGTESGGTHSHLWCDAEGSGTICHLCSATWEEPYLYRVRLHIDDLVTTHNNLDCTITLPEGSELISKSIQIYNHTNDVFTGYTHAWDGNILKIQFGEDLPVSVYRIYAETDSGLVPICDEFFGAYYALTPEATGQNASNFTVKHPLTGSYLRSSNGTLSAVPSEEWKRQGIFSNLSELVGDSAEPIRWIRYLYIQKDEAYNWYYALEHGGQYLSLKSDGTLFWSDTFTDECLWQIHEE